MNKLDSYIRNSLSVIFFSIFMPLFAIASIIFLVKLATYTSIIQLNLFEMFKLYLFMLPELLFHTIPITFFLAAALTLFKLSNDNEIVIIFSLGIHPKKLINILLKPALFLTIILIFNLYYLFPHTKTLSKNFMVYKKTQAKFNISASEFGHKFGDWLLYIGKENEDKTYADVVLFNKKKENEELLISAKKAEIINVNGLLSLRLSDGEGYSYSKDKFTQVNFKTMDINDKMTVRLYPYNTPVEYWSNPKYTKKLISNALFALFPLMSLFLILVIGIAHARYQKAKIYLYLFLSIIIYYSTAIAVSSIKSYYTVPTVALIWLIGTYILYRKQIVAKF